MHWSLLRHEQYFVHFSSMVPRATYRLYEEYISSGPRLQKIHKDSKLLFLLFGTWEQAFRGRLTSVRPKHVSQRLLFTLFFYKHTVKFHSASICLRFFNFELQIMLSAKKKECSVQGLALVFGILEWLL